MNSSGENQGKLLKHWDANKKEMQDTVTPWASEQSLQNCIYFQRACTYLQGITAPPSWLLLCLLSQTYRLAWDLLWGHHSSGCFCVWFPRILKWLRHPLLHLPCILFFSVILGKWAMRCEFPYIGGSPKNETRQEDHWVTCATNFIASESLNMGFHILRKGRQKAP